MDETIIKKTRIRFRNRYMLIVDALLILVSVLASFVLRLELGAAFRFYLPAAIWMAVIALLIKPIIYYYFGLYRRIWIYASTSELRLIVIAVTTAAVANSVVVIALVTAGIISPGLPRSVLPIDWLFSLIAVGGVRFSLRLIAEAQHGKAAPGRAGLLRRVLVIGAGDAGALVVREMQKNRQLFLEPVGYLDDDPTKQKHQIYGVPVIGKLSDLPRVLDSQSIDEVIIAIPSAPGTVVRMVADVCRLKGMPFRTMPGIYELIGGKVSVSRLREVDITDLLRREPARINPEQIGSVLKGKRVLVTGAGGSIGRELCRQIARWAPAEMVLLGHGENSIFETLLELRQNFPDLVLRPVIADVRDLSRLRTIFKMHTPQIVFHAAAHKHVPLMESNIEEAVTNNIIGTRNVVQTSVESQVSRLVMISTDKAIRPVNVMGATKRIAEMIVLDAAHRSGLSYSVVRFGNVLGSRGSVVPLFKQQIARGGPVTVTHPDMKRYFMTIPEAVHLVLQASAMGKGAEVFLLNMGQQVRILDLAEDLIRLSGLEPGKDIEIVFSGIRPGEKLSEDLWEDGMQFNKTDHPEIFQVDEESLSGELLSRVVNDLNHLAQQAETDSLLQMLDEWIPSAAVRMTPPPDMTSVV